MSTTTGPQPGELLKWSVRLHGKVWGADGETVWPRRLAELVEDREGREMRTYYKKPYTLSAFDAQSVYDFFDSEIDPRGARGETIEWETVPDEQAEPDAIP